MVFNVRGCLPKEARRRNRAEWGLQFATRYLHRHAVMMQPARALSGSALGKHMNVSDSLHQEVVD